MARGKAKKDDHATRGTAPSAADIEDLEKFEGSEDAQAHTPSSVDALGQDKRREVIGHSYGPSKSKQLFFFMIVAVIVAVLVGGSMAAVAAFDQPEDEYADEAPWSRSDAEQVPTRDPANPCGEPGNPSPPPEGSPCVGKPVVEPASDSQ